MREMFTGKIKQWPLSQFEERHKWEKYPINYKIRRFSYEWPKLNVFEKQMALCFYSYPRSLQSTNLTCKFTTFRPYMVHFVC